MDRKIKVAYVINDVLYGGAQVAVLNIAKRLNPEHFESIVYLLNTYPLERPSLESAYRKAGVRLEYIGSGGKTRIGKAIFALKARFKENRPDIIHAHLNDAIIASLIAGRLAGVHQFVIHENNSHSMYSWRVRFLLTLLRPLASLTVCYTPVLEEELFGVSSLLVPGTRVEKLPAKHCTVSNGIDIDAIREVKEKTDVRAKRVSLGIPEDAIVITSVARLVGWKGALFLLEAFGYTAATNPSLHLMLVGEGELDATLRARAKELGLLKRVHVLGVRQDAFELLAVSDIASLSFLYKPGILGEAVGLAGLEAMAMGLPLIASDYPSAHRFIENGRSGILVAPGNEDALANALRILAEDSGKRREIGLRASEFIKSNFDWEGLVPIYEQLYYLLTNA